MFPLFHNNFDIFLISGVKLHIHFRNLVVLLIFPSNLKSDMSRYGYLEVLSFRLRDNESRMYMYFRGLDTFGRHSIIAYNITNTRIFKYTKNFTTKK